MIETDQPQEMTQPAQLPSAETARERVLHALAFEEQQPPPYTLPIEDDVAARLDTHYGGPQWRAQVVNHILPVRIPGLSVIETVKPLYTDPFGVTWRTDARPYHQVQPALAEPDLSGYRWPAVDELWDAAAIQQQLTYAQNAGAFSVATTGFGLFERSWTLRGFENALTDMLLYPDFYHALLDGILEIQLGIIARLAELRVDGILLSDDWGDQRGVIMGPKLWRRFIQPRARQFFDAVHRAGKVTLQHCCGNVTEIIPEMIASGLDVLESLQPEAMDIYRIKREYGRELRLWGGLGTQQLIPFGKPNEIRGEIRRLKAEMGGGGGYILAPAKPLLSEVPTENAAAVVEEITSG